MQQKWASQPSVNMCNMSAQIHVHTKGCSSVILLCPKIGVEPPKHDVICMPTQQYTITNYILLERYHLVVSIMLRYMDQHSMTIWAAAKWKSTKNFEVTYRTLLSNATSFINIPTISGVSKWSIFPSLENSERIKGSAKQILRLRRHRAKNRISTLYRMTA